MKDNEFHGFFRDCVVPCPHRTSHAMRTAPRSQERHEHPPHGRHPGTGHRYSSRHRGTAATHDCSRARQLATPSSIRRRRVAQRWGHHQQRAHFYSAKSASRTFAVRAPPPAHIPHPPLPSKSSRANQTRMTPSAPPIRSTCYRPQSPVSTASAGWAQNRAVPWAMCWRRGTKSPYCPQATGAAF